MTTKEQKKNAEHFVEYWKDKGYEKGESQSFWLALLRDVLGVERPEEHIVFEEQVHLDHTSFIDAYIPETKVMIEQKSADKDLSAPIRQSDGTYLTPYKQAVRYISELPVSQHPLYVIVCNFKEFWIFDMEKPNGDPEILELKNLPQEFYRLEFLINKQDTHIQKELEVSVQAGEIVGKLYDALLAQYPDPESEEALHSLNVLCVRLVFCLYAENGGIFGGHTKFYDYLYKFDSHQIRKALIELFHVLDTPENERDPFIVADDEVLASFPYVNGGLFSDESITIPPFTDEIKSLLLEQASAGFDWSGISPTIFGAVFESTLNPETRRSGGMHYTSIENIHKVIDPLFLDGLKAEFDEIQQTAVEKTRQKQLKAFQQKLSGLTFLDPACGSGNFLTETYLSLRRLENEIVSELTHGQITLGDMDFTPIMVSLDQFYGIEINDFAVTVAKTALWIAEAQMMQETENIVHKELNFLPLKSYTNIVEGNALKMDWNDVILNYKLNYIMGNPPFAGNSRLTEEQKEDRNKVFAGKGGELDYVSCWYKKASDYIIGQPIKCAFVSTNSICQGQQVEPLWKPLMDSGIVINFAYTTFRWDSEASIKAHVYCVIIGFSRDKSGKRILFNKNKRPEIVDNINGYLSVAPNVFITKRRLPICNIPIVIKGLQPTDNGYLILSDEEKVDLLKKEPEAEQWIRPFITAKEFIHGKNRWCLWLNDITPAGLNSLPLVKERVIKCQEWRESQKKTGDAYKLKDKPTKMRQSSKFKESPFVVLPRHTGDRRKYVPFGFAEKGVIPGDSISIAIGANLYHFGVLESNIHMAWIKVVCGRLGTSFRYTSDVVYNNFPWPDPTPEQKDKIEKTAQTILDTRALYPDSSLADLYDNISMPEELQKAHQENDKAVAQAYGFAEGMTEEDYVAELMKMYQILVDGK